MKAALYARAIDTYLLEQVSKGFSGSVAASKGGKIILSKSYGNSSTVGKRPAFWLASISKSFAAAAIMRLAEQGRLTTDDPITMFFKDVPEDKRAITVHHLFSHTSGLPHRYAADGIAERDKAIAAILALPLRTKVGEKFGYSNDGYTLLAAIVEIASGRTYEDYVGAELLKRAGMKHTGFWGFERGSDIAQLANPAAASSVRETVYKDGRSVANWGYRGATGMYGTADDILRWITGLRDGKVLNRASLEKMWGRHALMQPPEAGEDLYYGYGFSQRYRNGQRLFVRHTGFEDWLGHNGIMTIFENGDAVVVLSNTGRNGDAAWATFVGREIHRQLGH